MKHTQEQAPRGPGTYLPRMEQTSPGRRRGLGTEGGLLIATQNPDAVENKKKNLVSLNHCGGKGVEEVYRAKAQRIGRIHPKSN